MEIITTLGFTLFLILPNSLWNHIPEKVQSVVTEKISQAYLKTYNCEEAERLILEQDDEIQFRFKCNKYTI